MTPDQKAARIARAKAHVAADRLRSGFYSDEGDHTIGCSVGCDAIDISGWEEEFNNPHAIVAAHDGTPEWLERLRDAVFEGLPKERRAWWHVALAESLPTDVDMQEHFHEFCFRLMGRQLERQSDWPEECREKVASAIGAVADLHRARSADGAAWTLAGRNAWNAAAGASRSAAESARSAAWSAAWRARSAAWSAAWSAAESARRARRATSAEFEWIAEMILRVLRGEPEPRHEG